MARPRADDPGTSGSPAPPPALAVIVQKASGGTIDTATSVSLTFATTPVPGNQIIVILGSLTPANILASISPPTLPVAPPAGWSSLAWCYYNTSSPLGIVAYRHVVQPGDGATVTFPIAAYNSAYFICMAMWEIGPSGQPITSGGDRTASGSSDSVSTLAVMSSSSALGTLGIAAAFNLGGLNGASPITFTAGRPTATWGADAFIYDTSGASYGMMLTALATHIAASVDVTTEFNFTPVNSLNPGAVALTLLFPPAS